MPQPASVSINTIMHCSRLLRGLLQAPCFPRSVLPKFKSTCHHMEKCSVAAQPYCSPQACLTCRLSHPLACAAAAAHARHSPLPTQPCSQSLALVRLPLHHRAFAYAVPSAWCTLPSPSSYLVDFLSSFRLSTGIMVQGCLP